MVYTCVMSKKKQTKRKPKKDTAQTALDIVEKATGTRLPETAKKVKSRKRRRSAG